MLFHLILSFFQILVEETGRNCFFRAEKTVEKTTVFSTSEETGEPCKNGAKVRFIFFYSIICILVLWNHLRLVPLDGRMVL